VRESQALRETGLCTFGRLLFNETLEPEAYHSIEDYPAQVGPPKSPFRWVPGRIRILDLPL